LKGLDGYVDKIVELITWPILKMVELVQKAKDWTMKKLEDTPLVGRIMKWFNKEGNKSTTKPELPPKKTESYNDLGYFAKGGITTRSGVGRLHASEAVIPLPPSVTEAITGRFIDRSEIAKRDTASRIAEGRFAAGEFGKKTGDITSQLKQGQAQINNAMVYTSNMMSNSNSSVASTIADSMSSKGGGGFSSGNDFASQVLKCNLS